LQSNFCQTHHPQARTNRTHQSLPYLCCANHFLAKHPSVGLHPSRNSGLVHG
jgi:hypothetical protein